MAPFVFERKNKIKKKGATFFSVFVSEVSNDLIYKFFFSRVFWVNKLKEKEL